MGEKVLMKGNEAIAEAAVRAGCRFYAGYPITPQSEIPEYMSSRLYEVGGQFVQAESELAAVNMVYGAGGAGVRAMTSSSSPGISLKQEGLSYLAGAEVPAVVVNMVRGGPGLGGIHPAQSDYFQSVKGGGHGDYRLLVLAGESVQELADLVYLAFAKADEYRNPVLILGDAVLGQIMEPLELPEPVVVEDLPPKEWATTGHGGKRPKNVINSLYLVPEALERHNLKLKAKYDRMWEREQRHASHMLDDAEVVVAAYGSTARVCRKAVDLARKKGIPAGLLRPISLWPFPERAFKAVVAQARCFLAVEMSLGQMIEDVRLATECRRQVFFYGRTGGVVPTPAEVLEAIEKAHLATAEGGAPATSGGGGELRAERGCPR